MLGFNAIGLDAIGMSGAPASQSSQSGIVNLLVSPSTQVNTSSTVAVTVTPGPKTVNVTGASCTQTAASDSASVTVSSAGQSIILTARINVLPRNYGLKAIHYSN